VKAISGILFCSTALFFLAGCVTSTTTSTASFEPSDDAAIQNYQLGARYYQNGSYELARERLEHALELDPKLAEAYYTLALTHEQLGNNRLAEENYSRAVKVEPNDYDARNAYAVFFCRQRKFDEAAKQFDRALKISNNSARHVVLTNAGACMTQKPDYMKAEQYFRDALTERPTHGEALVQLSALKFKTEEYLQARAFLQRYLSTNKSSPGVLYLGVQIEKTLGDERAATDYMNQLLREFPASPEARRLLESE
jgi:type IV pilus assembly protein PilF